MSTTLYPHRGAGPRFARPTGTHRRRILFRIVTTGNGTRYAVGPRRETIRRATSALLTLAALAGILGALSVAGRSDMRDRCDDVWHWTAYGTTAAADRMTCARMFPGDYPATDHLG